MTSPHACSARDADPTSLLLRRLFARAVHLSLVSTAATAAACGDEPDWPKKSDGFLLAPCDATADLTPARPVDYVALRQRVEAQAPETLNEHGKACATAMDKPACAAE